LLELIKTRYLGQINRESIGDLIQELDDLTTGLLAAPEDRQTQA